MARHSIAILLAAVFLCLSPVKSQVSLFLRGQADETPIESTNPETALTATEVEDLPVSIFVLNFDTTISTLLSGDLIHAHHTILFAVSTNSLSNPASRWQHACPMGRST